MKALDLYAGPGGWSLATQALGIDEIGVEWDAAACATARAAGHHRIQGDVRDHRDLLMPEMGLIASPPCQTFSAAGKGAGRKAMDDLLNAVTLVGRGAFPEEALEELGQTLLDERSALVLEPLRHICVGEPEWIALEQVPTVLPIWQAYAEVLYGWGYYVDTAVLNAEQFGVPQTRKRAILVANRTRAVKLPKPTHSRYYSRTPGKLDEGVLPWVSMAQALSWGLSQRPSPTITGGGTDTGGAEPIAHLNRYTDRDDWIMRSNYGTSGDASVRGERSMAQPAPTVTSKINRNKWVPVIANEGNPPESVEWVHTRPSPTIVGSFAPDVVAAPGYRKPGDGPRQKAVGSVRVTVQEAGILQTFPVDYPWQGSKSAQYLQVGNAIPPLLAQRVLEAVL